MKYPVFFDSIEPLTLQDDLSAFLGSSEEGIIDISYLEIVKMAGHSCAVVSGAFLMAQKGLKALYGNDIPQRGHIKVELRDSYDDGNTPVFGQIFSNITGATLDSGFLGIGERFNRRNRLFYGAPISSFVRFTRLDTNDSVGLNFFPGKVVVPGEIMQMAIGPNATEESKKAFPKKWQEMVQTLFENADKIIEIVK